MAKSQKNTMRCTVCVSALLMLLFSGRGHKNALPSVDSSLMALGVFSLQLYCVCLTIEGICGV